MAEHFKDAINKKTAIIAEAGVVIQQAIKEMQGQNYDPSQRLQLDMQVSYDEDGTPHTFIMGRQNHGLHCDMCNKDVTCFLFKVELE